MTSAFGIYVDATPKILVVPPPQYAHLNVLYTIFSARVGNVSYMLSRRGLNIATGSPLRGSTTMMRSDLSKLQLGQVHARFFKGLEPPRERETTCSR
jgi:hypothetical protein